MTILSPPARGFAPTCRIFRGGERSRPAWCAVGVWLLLSTVSVAATAGLISDEQEARIEALIRSMSLEQKVAQMVQPEIRYVTVEDQRRYGFGSILNGGGSFPAMNKHATAEEWLALADAYHRASLDRSQGSAGIPVIWGSDAVHGHNNVYRATLFPHNIGLGATDNPALAGEIAAATALEVRATGIDWIFAPTVAVALDPRWGRTYESYSSEPDRVVRFTAPVVRGLQSLNTLATAKHFIGDGATRGGVDQGDVRLPLDELLRVHGPGYRRAIDAGVLTIMASFNSWNGDKVHGSKQLLTDVLKNQMGFEGVVVSDWNGIGQVRYCANDDCVQAINAGIDMVMVPQDWKSFLETTVGQVRAGDIPVSRIDDAVRRILRVKMAAGLLESPSLPSVRADELPSGVLGAPAHRALAAQAVRESLVLLKNTDGVLPLRDGARILVAGSVAHNIALQSGGWTLSWQGTGNSNEDFPGATSIFDGIRQRASAGGGSAALSPDGAYEHKPDVAVVVFGERPYAEGAGDVEHLNHSARYPEDLALMRRLQRDGIPVVGIFVTGRPAWTHPELNASEAFVVAWLPGSEGAAVADVLFGTPGSDADFRGVLPMPWPAHDASPSDPSETVSDALFPVGYGLRMSQRDRGIGKLDESTFGAPASPEEVLFHRRSQPPWVLTLMDSDGAVHRFRGPRTVVASGGLRVESRDHAVQEDARRLHWRDGLPGAAVFWAHVDGGVTDLTEELSDTAVLAVELRVDAPPTGPVEWSMRCGPDCAGTVDMSTQLREATPGDWLSLEIPLSCFVRRGADLRQVTSPLSIASHTALDMTIADLRFRDQRPGDAPTGCGDDSAAAAETP